MTTASGTREVSFARQSVWRALTALTPYCPVCDVSYVFSEGPGTEADAVMGKGTRFVCAQGRLDGMPPPQGAVSGEVVEWVAEERIGTRLELASENWQTRVELADASPGVTRVTVTVSHDSQGGNRLRQVLQRKAMQRMVQQTVDSELAKLPDHVSWLSERRSDVVAVEREAAPVEQAPSSVEQERDGWVVHLRGEIDAPAVDRLGLQRRLEELAVVAIDVRGLTYIDSVAFPPLQRWAKRTSRAGGHAVIRGDNPYFDQMLGVMGLTSMFRRET